MIGLNHLRVFPQGIDGSHHGSAHSAESSADSLKHVVEKNLHASKFDRFREHWRMILIVVIPLVVLLIISSIALKNSLDMKASILSGKTSIDHAIRYTRYVSLIQQERGMSTIYISSNNTDNDTFAVLMKIRKTVDHSFQELLFPDDGVSLENVRYTKEGFVSYLADIRDNVQNGSLTVIETMDFYTVITKCWLKYSIKNLDMPPGKELYSAMIASSALVQATDVFGIQRGLGGTYFYVCRGDYLKVFDKLEGQGYAYLTTAFSYSSKVENIYLNSPNNISLQGEVILSKIETMLQPSELERCLRMSDEERFVSSQTWFHNMTTFMNEIVAIHEDLLFDVYQILAEMVNEALLQYAAYISVQVIVTLLSITFSAWYMVSLDHLTLRISQYAKDAHSNSKKLAMEKRTTEKLLYRMIPQKVAIHLKTTGSAPAEFFNEATVFFSDVVNFTQIGNRSTPMQIVDLLNSLYSVCDVCIDRYDVYKVETIGDAYMVASGVPNPNGIQHCFEIARMALDIRDNVNGFKVAWLDNQVINIRIGIHSGPVVAGVIGTKMPRYCLFGDTVNTASRMESTGEAGKIQLSESSHRIIKTQTTYKTTKRGLICVKGKGQMSTFWLDEYEPVDGKNVQIAPFFDVNN